MLLDDLFRGMIFGVGVLVVVFLTAALFIKIMLSSQEQAQPSTKTKRAEKGSRNKGTANTTALNEEHGHIVSRKIIPIKSTEDFSEELEISVMEEDDEL